MEAGNGGDNTVPVAPVLLTAHFGVLFEEIWRNSYDVCADGALKFQINHLRRKFREFGRVDIIETVWGVGYRLKGKGDDFPSC